MPFSWSSDITVNKTPIYLYVHVIRATISWCTRGREKRLSHTHAQCSILSDCQAVSTDPRTPCATVSPGRTSFPPCERVLEPGECGVIGTWLVSPLFGSYSGPTTRLPNVIMESCVNQQRIICLTTIITYEQDWLRSNVSSILHLWDWFMRLENHLWCFPWQRL